MASTTTVAVVVHWGEAAAKVFRTKRMAEQHLRRQGLRRIDRDLWAESEAELDQGWYASVFVETIRE